MKGCKIAGEQMDDERGRAYPAATVFPNTWRQNSNELLLLSWNYAPKNNMFFDLGKNGIIIIKRPFFKINHEMILNILKNNLKKTSRTALLIHITD